MFTHSECEISQSWRTQFSSHGAFNRADMPLLPLLAELFQNSIDTGIIPDDWLTANVVGIYKKGDKQEPANYRPVSLTSVMCKVLEHIIYSQIMSHYNKHNFLSEYQHGFRRGYSCETQLLATVEDIQRGIDSSSNS